MLVNIAMKNVQTLYWFILSYINKLCLFPYVKERICLASQLQKLIFEYLELNIKGLDARKGNNRFFPHIHITKLQLWEIFFFRSLRLSRVPVIKFWHKVFQAPNLENKQLLNVQNVYSYRCFNNRIMLMCFSLPPSQKIGSSRCVYSLLQIYFPTLSKRKA